MYWVTVKDGSELVAVIYGGKSFREAIRSTDGNYGVQGIRIFGPCTRQEAIALAKGEV